MSRDIFEMVRELNIVEVMEDYITIEGKRGNEYKTLCPFHNDNALGNFLINPTKGIFMCFSCGVGGDAIEFVSLYKNVSRLEAAAEIAFNKNLINIFEYEKHIHNSNTLQYEPRKKKTVIRKYKKRNSNYILDEIGVKADNQKLDKVYNIFLDSLELSEGHREHLIKARGIPIDIIKKRKYRTYPTHEEMGDIFDKLYLEFGELDNILKGVPGFYKEKIGDRWRWRLVYNEGIIIPIRNAKEQIIALHLRADKKKNGIKYKWVSSNHYMYTSNNRFGVSSSAPLDVIYPEERPNNVLFVTEGRFKSEMIAKEINSVSISVQGIGNWSGIERKIYETEDYLKQKYEGFLGFVRIYIAFDIDVYNDLQKYKQLKKMSDFIQNQFLMKEIYYIEWDKTYKGIDDFILNNKRNEPKDYGELFNLIDKESQDKEMENK
ncbi:MAG: DUF3854 domain-containing protein [Tissierellia bacterium]|nr:DUF3854 domain-containing protein [Tissierellia bacterium]